MVAPLSIIIPTLNAAGNIGPTLASLASGIGQGLICELIIVDGGSTDAVADIADHAGALFVTCEKGRGTQLAAGAQAAKGAWLMFVHADTVLAPNWPQSVGQHIAISPTKAAYFRLRFDQNGHAARFVAHWANLRARLFNLPYGDQGLLISRRHYDAIGGFDPIPLFEDVAIARRIGRQMCQIDAAALTSAKRYRRQGWLRRSMANHLLLLRYFLGAAPQELAKAYEDGAVDSRQT